MKIMKTAANIPPGYVVLEVRIPRNGPVKAKIVREGASQCAEGDEKRLIDGVLNGPLPGFGNQLGTTVGQGRTGEYWKQVAPKVPDLKQPATPEDEEGRSVFGPKTQEKELDQGYGV